MPYFYIQMVLIVRLIGMGIMLFHMTILLLGKILLNVL